MKQSKEIKFDAYRVHYRGTDDLPTFRSLVMQAFNSKQERTIAYDPYKVAEFQEKNGLVVADVERNKIADPLPRKARKGSASKPLGLDDDEGLVHGTAFAFWDTRRGPITLLQRNRQWMGSNQLAHLLALYVTEPIELEFHRLLRADAYKRVLQMEFYKSVRIKVATPNADLVLAGTSDGYAINLSSALSQSNIELILAVGRGETLDKGWVRKLVKWWHGLDAEDDDEVVKKLKVEGREDLEEGESEAIDLIKAGISGSEDVPLVKREATFAGRRKALLTVKQRVDDQITAVLDLE